MKASSRSALEEGRGWFEQALAVLDALPERPSGLEQGFEIRLALRPVLITLGEVRRALERVREAEGLAERLNDDHRRGRVCAAMTNTHSHLGELDQALATATRGLEIARRIDDVPLRILNMTNLEQAHYFRGDYERVVELATDHLAALPAGSDHESFGSAVPPSIYARYRLLQSFRELGRFAEAARYGAEALQLAESLETHHAWTVGMILEAVSALHRTKGEWAKALALAERGIAAWRGANIVLGLPTLIAQSARSLAQLGDASEALARVRESEQLLERDAARGYYNSHRTAYESLGHACLLLGRLDEARRMGERAVEHSRTYLGNAARAQHLLGVVVTHPGRFDAMSGEAHYRQALALAEPRGMRPLIAHCELGLGKLYGRTGRRERAHEHLNRATAMYRDMDMRFWLHRLESEAKELG